MKILSSCYLSKKYLFFNKKMIAVFQEDNWLKEAYHFLQMDYPKFHKMDNLSKMTLIANEVIKKYSSINFSELDDVEMIFANSSASQNTDLKFIDSYINQSSPSPSLFVYTLPNILTGELSIRNSWYGENVFFISECFDSELFTEQLYHASNRGKKYCLCGWVDSKIVENSQLTEECFLFLVNFSEKNQNDELNLHQNKLKNLLDFYRKNQNI